MNLIFLTLYISSFQPPPYLFERLAKAYSDESEASKLLHELSSVENPSALELAYLGSVEMVMADHVFWPNKKFSYFQQGKKKLEKAVSEESNNLEIRYLRLAVQSHCPALLNYDDNIEEDAFFLLEHLSSISNTKLKAKAEQLLKKEGYIHSK